MVEKDYKPLRFFLSIRSIMRNDSGIDLDVSSRIMIDWAKWKAAIWVLCDRYIHERLKGTTYKIVFRQNYVLWLQVLGNDNKYIPAELLKKRR